MSRRASVKQKRGSSSHRSDMNKGSRLTPPDRHEQRGGSPNAHRSKQNGSDSHALNVEAVVSALEVILAKQGDDPKNISCIAPYLYLGNVDNALDVTTLKDLRITHILNVGGKEVTKVPDYRKKVAKVFRYKQINAEDELDYDMTQHVQEVHEFIERVRTGGGRVFLHCFGGVNRSAFCVCAHLMLRGQQLIPTVQCLKRQRGAVLTNNFFVRQLAQLAVLNKLA